MREMITDPDYFEGTAMGHFGEFLQGYLPSDLPFLVSCPINIYCKCRIYKQPLSIPLRLDAKKKVFLSLFEDITGRKMCHPILFESPIPRGIGMGSSTADLVALFRALNQMFDDQYPLTLCEEIISRIEPSDSTMHRGLLVFNHYEAKPIYFIQNQLKDFVIVGVIEKRCVETIDYNKSLSFSTQEKYQYTRLLEDLIYACEHRDLELFGEISTLSLELNLKRNFYSCYADLKQLMREKIVSGIVGAHSGSCSGVFLATDDKEIEDKVAYIKQYLTKKGKKPILYRTNFSSLDIDEGNNSCTISSL